MTPFLTTVGPNNKILQFWCTVQYRLLKFQSNLGTMNGKYYMKTASIYGLRNCFCLFWHAWKSNLY